MDALGLQREEFHIPVLASNDLSFFIYFISTLFKPKMLARNSVKVLQQAET